MSAARTIIEQERLIVPDYNDDKSDIVEQIKAAKISLSNTSFKIELMALVDNYIFNAKQLAIINKAKIGKIPDEIKPILIQYIKASPIPIDNNNANYFLPLFISQINGGVDLAEATTVDPEEAAKDFHVDFLARRRAHPGQHVGGQVRRATLLLAWSSATSSSVRRCELLHPQLPGS